MSIFDIFKKKDTVVDPYEELSTAPMLYTDRKFLFKIVDTLKLYCADSLGNICSLKTQTIKDKLLLLLYQLIERTSDQKKVNFDMDRCCKNCVNYMWKDNLENNTKKCWCKLHETNDLFLCKYFSEKYNNNSNDSEYYKSVSKK